MVTSKYESMITGCSKENSNHLQHSNQERGNEATLSEVGFVADMVAKL